MCEKFECSTQQPNRCSKELKLCGCEQECPLCHFYFFNLTCLTLTVSMVADHSHKSQVTASHVGLKMNDFGPQTAKKLDLLDNLNLLILSVTTQNDECKYCSSSVGM